MNNSFFSPESEFITFLGKVTDIILLNLLCLFCSIPIVTIGASFTARNYVAMKLIKGDEPDVSQSFFKSFRENFFQITKVWLVLLAICILVGMDWYLILTRRILIGAGFKIALSIISFIFWSIIYCMFYFIARFEVTTKELIKASVVMAFLNAPRMVLIFIGIFLPYLICAWYLEWGLAIWLLTSTVALYLISKEYNHQLEMIVKGEGNESENIG